MAEVKAVLAVDGSVRGRPLAALADLDGGLLAAAYSEGDSGTLGQAVSGLISGLRLSLVAVVAVRGPGSYIGVRAGLAVALGVAQGLAVPLSLVGALEVVGNRVGCLPQGALAIAGAGRGAVYLQKLEAGAPGAIPVWRAESPAFLLSPAEAIPPGWSQLDAVLGEGVGDWEGLGERRILDPIRSREEALCLLSALCGHQPTSYDQVSADYGRQLGGGE